MGRKSEMSLLSLPSPPRDGPTPPGAFAEVLVEVMGGCCWVLRDVVAVLGLVLLLRPPAEVVVVAAALVAPSPNCKLVRMSVSSMGSFWVGMGWKKSSLGLLWVG